jgi:hypothetical protein
MSASPTLDWTTFPAASKAYARGPIAATMNRQGWTPGISTTPGRSDPSTGAIGKNWPSQNQVKATTVKTPSPNVFFIMGLFFVVVWLESGKRGGLL